MTTTNGGIGASAVRVEDDAFLRGNGRFMDDINVPGQIYAAFVRSPHANAQVRRIDTASVSDWDGVVAVLTPADLLADDVGVVHAPSGLKSADGTPIRNPQQRALTDHPRCVL